MKQVAALLALLIAVMLLAALSQEKDFLAQLTKKEAPAKQKVYPVEIDGEVFEVEVARTEAERATGLTQKSSLEAAGGMLFIFPQADVRPQFWMKGMKFAIDIIWIDEARVVEITHEAEAVVEDTPDNEVPLYLPKQPVDFVLEIKAGEAERREIEVGDEVKLPEL